MDSPERAGVKPIASRLLRSRFMASRASHVAMLLLLALSALALLVPLLSPFGVDAVDMQSRLGPPSSVHWLGTDGAGRDVFTRLAFAGRISLSVSIVAVLVAMPSGTLIGLTSGFLKGFADALLMRLTDAFLSVPLFMFLLILLSMLKPAAETVIVVIGLTTWMAVARLVRGEVMRVVPEEYILAARAVGVPERRILFRHVLPQVMPVIIVAATVGIPQAILLESTLSFFGLGVQPPTPTWGNMLGDAQQFVWNAPLLALWPGLAIVLTVIAFNIAGEVLRESLTRA